MIILKIGTKNLILYYGHSKQHVRLPLDERPFRLVYGCEVVVLMEFVVGSLLE